MPQLIKIYTGQLPSKRSFNKTYNNYTFKSYKKIDWIKTRQKLQKLNKDCTSYMTHEVYKLFLLNWYIEFQL